MLVIISDTHLTDGTTGVRISSGAFRLFCERLESMALDASKRSDDQYEPVRQFDLLLLGDIFDVLRSTRWTEQQKGEPGYARPWCNLDDSDLAVKLDQIVDGILQNNAESFEVLRSLADGTGISLPPPTKSGQVNLQVSRDHRSKLRLPVKVNIHYVTGNHDWLLHIKGAAYDRIRQKIITTLGLCNLPNSFPHDPSESPLIQPILSQHQVFARHGDIYDSSSYNKEKGRDYSCFGDAFVVELFNPFPRAVETTLGNQLPPEFYKDLYEMGSVRPGLLGPVWVAGLLERHQVDKKKRAAINEIWRSLLDRFTQLDFLDELDRPGLDIIDALELLMKIFRGISLEKLSDYASAAEKLASIHSALLGGGDSTFEKQAAREEAYLGGDARFVVYGHTHGYKVVPLRSIHKDDKPYDQLYINSGTWHPIHELSKFDNGNKSFIMHKTMTYLGFYRKDERKGRLFETWSGALDV